MFGGPYRLRSLWLLLISLSTFAGVLAAPAYAAGSPSGIAVEDGVTQPVFSYADAVREHVEVRTGLDTDQDGRRDRVAIDIIRPRATEEQDLRVPVIIDASPYYDNAGRGNEGERKTYGDSGRPRKFPLFYDNYFVPRGYAVVLVDMIGTSKSQGCPTTGGAAEVLGVKAVIDWLNGRGTAQHSDGSSARPHWATGKVAMVGKSYDGTLANGVAATGVEGLETIVPIAAISSWYDYYRYGGAIYYPGGPRYLADFVDTDPDAKCTDVRRRLDARADDGSGDYNAFWAERDYREGTVADGDDVEASVFAVHSLNDLNVKAHHFSQWWEELSQNRVPRKLWLSLTGHVDPFDFRREVWIDTLHRWFDHWLYGVDNGIMTEPRVDLQVAPQQWETQAAWPAKQARDVRMWFGPAEGERPGTLTGRPVPAQQTQRFTDDPEQGEWEMIAGQFSADPNRLIFLSPPLEHPVRMSGTPQVELAARADQADTNLTALVVDYGRDLRVDHLGRGEGVTTLDEEGCYGKSTEADDACYHLTRITTEKAPAHIVSRGWLDARNRKSLTEEEPLVPGHPYRFRWELLPHDYVFDAGHRIAVVVAASDDSFITSGERARGAAVTVSLGRSHVKLPVVGGQQALQWQRGGGPAGARREVRADNVSPPPHIEQRIPRRP